MSTQCNQSVQQVLFYSAIASYGLQLIIRELSAFFVVVARDGDACDVSDWFP